MSKKLKIEGNFKVDENNGTFYMGDDETNYRAKKDTIKSNHTILKIIDSNYRVGEIINKVSNVLSDIRKEYKVNVNSALAIALKAYGAIDEDNRWMLKNPNWDDALRISFLSNKYTSNLKKEPKAKKKEIKKLDLDVLGPQKGDKIFFINEGDWEYFTAKRSTNKELDVFCRLHEEITI